MTVKLAGKTRLIKCTLFIGFGGNCFVYTTSFFAVLTKLAPF